MRRPSSRRVLLLVGRLLLLLGLLYLPYITVYTLAEDRFFSLPGLTWRYPRAVVDGKVPVGAPRRLLLGDSTMAFAVVPRQLPDTIALASNGASSVELYLMLERYLGRHPRPECVVLGYTYVNRLDFIRRRFWEFPVSFGFFGMGELLDLYDESERVGGFPATADSRPAFIARALLTKAKLTPQSLAIFQRQALRSDGGSRYRQSFAALVRDQGTFTERRVPLADNRWWAGYIQQPFVPEPTLDLYLRKLSHTAEQLGIALVYVHPPLHPELDTPATRAHLAQLFAHVRRLFSDNAGAIVAEQMPAYEARLFRDQFHLSQEGAQRYTHDFAGAFRCEP